MKNLKNKIRNGIVTGLALVIFGCSSGGVPTEVINNIEKDLNKAMRKYGLKSVNHTWGRAYDGQEKYIWQTRITDFTPNKEFELALRIENDETYEKFKYNVIVDINKKKVIKIRKKK